MTLTEILEESKEKLIRQLDAAATVDQARPVLEAAIDRTLYKYNENCPDDRMREAAAGYLRAVRTAVPLVNSVGDVRAFERIGTDASGKRRSGIPVLFIIFLAAGAALAAVLLLTQTKLLMIPTALVTLIGAAVCFFLAGRFSVRTAGKNIKKELRFECLADGDVIYRTLHSVMMVADQCLDQLDVEERWNSSRASEKSGNQLSDAELTLFSGLLEAAASGDAEYAFDKLSEIRFYLHTRNVDVVDYSPEYAAWFDRMPSDTAETLRPALVSGGKLLKKGLASIAV